MKLGTSNMCDFCFEPVEEGGKCHKCGLTHETYKPSPGLLTPGANLMGKYIIGRALGRGGFGATYTAYSSDRAKAVAVKEYLPVSISYRSTGEDGVAIVSEDKRDLFERGAKSFFEEAKTISKFINNKNVVSVYEFFYANGTVYYSMEYLDGMDLKKYVGINGGKLSQSKVLKIVREVCNALISIHSTQTLHRDISPDNIFICSNGDVKLIDFGAAKQMVSEETQGYSVVLKQGFAPVEQYTRNGKQGVWTDIYALGATMYYALLGKIPPDAIDRVDNPELEFDSDASLSPSLANIIKKCMAYRIGDRYQSVIELLSDLDKLEVDDEESSLAYASEIDEEPISDEDAEQKTEAFEENNNPSSNFGNSTDSKGIANRKNIIIVAAALAVLVVLIVALAFGGGSSDKHKDEGIASDSAAITSDATVDDALTAISDIAAGYIEDIASDGAAQSSSVNDAEVAANEKASNEEPAKPKSKKSTASKSAVSEGKKADTDKPASPPANNSQASTGSRVTGGTTGEAAYIPTLPDTAPSGNSEPSPSTAPAQEPQGIEDAIRANQGNVSSGYEHDLSFD